MSEFGTFAEHMTKLFSTDSILRQCYPLVRLVLLLTLTVVWHIHSPWAVLCFAVVFVFICAFAPLNPLRPKLLVFVLVISTVAWGFQLLRGVEATESTVNAVLLLGRIFILISVALLFMQLLDARAIMDIVRAIPLVRVVAPAVVSFVRLWPHSKWIAQRVGETSHARGFLRGVLSSPRYGVTYLSEVATPYLITVLLFLDEYAEVLALRGGSALHHRAYKWDYRKTPSTVVFVVSLLLWYVALKDWEIL